MSRKTLDLIRHNVITAFVITALPLLVALVFFGAVLFKVYAHLFSIAFIAVIVAIIIEYPYLKLCDRYIFK